MKRILVLILAFVLVLSATACGESDISSGSSTEASSKNIGGDSKAESNTASNEDSNNTKFSVKKEIDVFSIYCPSDCAIDNSIYGYCFSYGSDFIVMAEYSARDEDFAPVENLEDAVEACEPYLCKSLEREYFAFFRTGDTTQTVRDTKKVNINGKDALRVVGTLDNTKDKKPKEYVAYYFLSNAKDGEHNYPYYIIGFQYEGTASALAEFVDEMVSFVK